MYEDPWYSFIPDAPGRQDEAAPQKLQHRRRESLLKQPTGNDDRADALAQTLGSVREGHKTVKSPPLATTARRAKSYSDFYHVARAQLAREHKEAAQRRPAAVQSKVVPHDGHTFQDLFQAHEEGLLNASVEEFQYATTPQQRSDVISEQLARIYEDQLALSQRHLDALLQQTSSTLDLLTNLSKSFKAVETQTVSFQSQCVDVLSDQTRLKTLLVEVGTGLQYYTYLETVARRLNAPGAAKVIGDEGFYDILTNVDACIEYLLTHPKHKEADIYLTRYTSVLARAINVISNVFGSTIDERQAEIKRKLAQHRQEGKEALTATKVYVLLADESVSAEPKLSKSLRHIVEKAGEAIRLGPRTATAQVTDGKRDYLTTYKEALDRMLLDYVNSRADIVPELIDVMMRDSMSEDFSPKADFLGFTRNSFNTILDLCANEEERFVNLFDGQSSLEFEDWSSPIYTAVYNGAYRSLISKIVSRVFDILKPDIENAHLFEVVDLVIWANTFTPNRRAPGQISALDSEEDEYEDDEQEGWRSGTQAKGRVAEDIKKKMMGVIFTRIREVIAKEIEHFVPKSEDLVLGTRTSNHSNPSDAKKDENDIFSADVSDRLVKALGPGILEGYPPVLRASELLVNITDLKLEPNGDQEPADIAYEVLHQTCSAILRGMTQVIAKSTKIDGRLFAVKNLLILKNLVVTYDISGSRRASTLDFTDIWHTFGELRARGGFFELGIYYRLLTSGRLIPKVVENIQDARVELDGQLRENITRFREEAADLIAKSASAGKRGAMTAEEIIKQRILEAFPQEQQLRDSLWDAVKTFGDDKKRVGV